MAVTYNQPSFSKKFLLKYKGSPPSFTIDLYDDHWTLNKGHSKFLYTQPVSVLLDEVRALRIPVDFIEVFRACNVPYYEACLIVETTDHRKSRPGSSPESERVVLQSNAESIYADICLLNAQSGNTWTDMQAIQKEAEILNEMCPPLFLEPDIDYSRVVNTVIRATTLPDTVPRKRKQVEEPEEDENDKAKRAKLMSQYMHPQHGKVSAAQVKRSIFDILHDIATKDDKNKYTLKVKPQKKEPKKEGAVPALPPPPVSHQPPQPTVNALVPASVSVAVPVVHEEQKAKININPVKKIGMPDVQSLIGKGKVKSMPNTVPVPSPLPIHDQRKPVPAPPISKTPIDTTGASPANHGTQYQQVAQASASPRPPSHPTPTQGGINNPKRKGVLKKSEEQLVQQVSRPQSQAGHPQTQPAHTQAQVTHPQTQAAHPHTQIAHPQTQVTHPHIQTAHAQSQQQPHAQAQPAQPVQPHAQPAPAQTQPTQPTPQGIPPEMQASWQPPMPSAQYLSQPPQSKKKGLAQQTPQQGPQYAPHATQPGFPNPTGFPQAQVYKNQPGIAQSPNTSPPRGSPMAPNQQLLSRDPLPPQSPHPPQQPQPHPGTTAPQHPHQMPHPHANHQFNMRLQQQQQHARFSPALQGQPGHHPQAMPPHPVLHQHQPVSVARNPQGHDPSQPMIHPQMQYPAGYPYPGMHPGMVNGLRLPNMPGGQAPPGQYMVPGWRPAAGRGGGPPVPMNAQQYQQHQQMMAAAMRAHVQQSQQAQGPGR